MRTDKLTGLKGTTRVYDDGNNVQVYYHNTKVASYDRNEKTVYLRTDGWVTFMTATKIQQLFNQYGLPYWANYKRKQGLIVITNKNNGTTLPLVNELVLVMV